MAYNPGMFNKRITILAPSQSVTSDFGRVSGDYVELRKVWAKVDWSRGVKSMRQGALDAYDSIMVRCNWYENIKRDCRLRIDGVDYAIDSLHADRGENTMQITASELQ